MCGGYADTNDAGQYYAPTLLVDVDHTMLVTQEESFGPVMVRSKLGGERGGLILSVKQAAIEPPHRVARDGWIRSNATAILGARFPHTLAQTVIKTQSDVHAINLVNDSPFGLGASVFAGSESRARFVASNIRSGMVNINDFGVNYLCMRCPLVVGVGVMMTVVVRGGGCDALLLGVGVAVMMTVVAVLMIPFSADHCERGWNVAVA